MDSLAIFKLERKYTGLAVSLWKGLGKDKESKGICSLGIDRVL